MFTRLFETIFGKLPKQTEIDTFVASKNPQSIAEAEHWAREYERKNSPWSARLSSPHQSRAFVPYI
jgi:hypothetical protein